jgi:hypothetical protein
MKTTAVSLLLRLREDGPGGASPLDLASTSPATSLCEPNRAAAVETLAAVIKRRREVSGISVFIMSLLTVHTSDVLRHRDIDALPASTTRS